MKSFVAFVPFVFQKYGPSGLMDRSTESFAPEAGKECDGANTQYLIPNTFPLCDQSLHPDRIPMYTCLDQVGQRRLNDAHQ